MKASKRFVNGCLSIHTGSEGPYHDPYSYTEYSIRRGETKATLHQGLGTWLKINGEKVPDDRAIKEITCEDDICELPIPHTHKVVEEEYEKVEARRVKEFEKICGISLNTFEKAIHRPTKCCKKPRLESVAGYPGEHFTICRACGEIVNSYFNRSEIE